MAENSTGGFLKQNLIFKGSKAAGGFMKQEKKVENSAGGFRKK